MNRPQRIYIAGPMTGVAMHNFPAFFEAARILKEAGWEVVNPAENFGGRTDLPRTAYLRADVALLVHCDAMAMLPGWEDSEGAKLEYLLAHMMGMPMIEVPTLHPINNAPMPLVQLQQSCASEEAPLVASEPILDEAKRITSSDRQDDYGHPREDFAHTASMWTGILAGKLRRGAEITAMDVPLCMIAIKLARQAHRHKRDNLVDIAGYARTAAMVAGDE